MHWQKSLYGPITICISLSTNRFSNLSPEMIYEKVGRGASYEVLDCS